MTEYGPEKDVRNALANTICPGMCEIQRTRIAAMLGLSRRRATRHAPREGKPA
ncbi:hypothetical protein [Streptomyces sp. NPDC020996]|uniref:hypothetical protein n=1 Tax=Streptomyces sp. NPDC020996 TaxID=3154791 RepID=UPI0033D74248